MLYNRTFLSFLTVIGGFPVPQLVIVCTTANSQSIPFLPLLATISLDDHFFRASSIYSSAKYYWAPTVCWALCKVLEKAVAPHSSTLAWKIPWMQEPGRLQSMGSPRVGHDWVIHFHFSLSCIGEGDGNPHQCSCLENPRDGGAWWAAVYGVAQSRTRLKWLSSSSMQSVDTAYTRQPWFLPS